MKCRLSLVRVSAACGTAAVCLWIATSGAAEEPLNGDAKKDATPKVFVPKTTAAEVEAWRKKYPYVSLSDRLAHERTHRDAPRPRVKHEPEVDQDRIRNNWGVIVGEARAESFRMLHEMKVDEFIAREGNGFSRMLPPGPGYLRESIPSEPIPFATVAPSSGEAESALVIQLSPDEEARARAVTLQKVLPSRAAVREFHREGVSDFASPFLFGHVKSVESVAGFEPHAFIAAPRGPLDLARVTTKETQEPWKVEEARRWKIARLELVSLLKHDTARVYLSENLPRMQDLSSTRTRPLTKFESDALQQLREGEELEIAAAANRIEMLGSVRATEHCVQCHQVPRGTLLGAFSYDLRRDPPIKVDAPVGGLQQ